jgi:hypothetical protein
MTSRSHVSNRRPWTDGDEVIVEGADPGRNW